ncbi:MAG: NAD(+) diphosphatase [Syntrophobacteraceae bacterium]
MPFEPAVKLTPSGEGPAYWFFFSNDRLLVRMGNPSARVPYGEEGPPPGIEPIRCQALGTLDRVPCYSAELPPDAAPPEGFSFIGLRRLFGILDETLYSIAVRAKQIVAWDQTHQYCGRCAAPTRQAEDERARVCPACGLTNFPRIAPAVIVAVTRGDELLLARAQRFPEGFYSVLAGFVEAGETLEECACREIREEVGVEVANIRYFGSQSWPFPHSLMIGFTAEYAGGEIRPDPSEIADARWFRSDRLPDIPEKISIARSLIDWFVESRS